MDTDASPDMQANAIDRLAAALDASGVTLDVLALDFPGWRIWHSEVTGACHARRVCEGGRFTERESDGRRFHVAASTPARLAVLLLAQAAADAEQG